MKEATFTTEVMRSLRHYDLWAFKIPDMPITKAILKITRFTNAKPADIVACLEDKFIAIETKQFKKWEALGLRHFRPEQVSGMSSIVEQGGRAFVFLNIRIARKENRLLIFDWKTLHPKLQKGSVKAKELRERPYSTPFVLNDKIHYDLTEWLLFL